MLKNNSKIMDHPTQEQALSGLLRVAAVALLAVSLGGCNLFTRLSEVGSAPPLSEIQNPGAGPNGVQPISLPMPAPVEAERHANSLWRPGSRAFLKDQRAARVGDILTVVINIEDQASINNTTTRSRDAEESAALPSFLGFESQLNRILPNAVDPTSLVDFSSDSLSTGSGAVDRDESIDVRIAALVTQVLPNGNMVLAGRQEVRVNYEVRELTVAGIIRPEDITNVNTISYDQIAEARISYGGRGQLSDVQQARYGQQLYDILWPF